MRIEDYWIDGFLYYVEFQVKQGDLYKIVRKYIVVYEEMEIQDVRILVGKKFGNVIVVKMVEFYQEILLVR